MTTPPSDPSYTDLDGNLDRSYNEPPDENESIYNEICKMMEVKQDVPMLPPRSALRKTRPMHKTTFKKMDTVDIKTPMTNEVMAHDVYLSSEEDASSAADDFSDYQDDSSTDSQYSPSRRSSYEGKARVVSVVFAGKPSLVELSPRRRTPSPFSTRSTFSTKSCGDRPPTPSSSISSTRQTSTKSLPVTRMKKTPFLHIDPFANGSTYSLEMVQEPEEVTPLRKTRTHSPLARGLARTLGLSKRRSRTSLNTAFLLSQRRSSAPISPEKSPGNEDSAVRTMSTVVSSPVTYESILKAAMGNSLISINNTLSRHSQLPPASPSPTTESNTSSPVGAKKASLLSGLSVRRRSGKFPG